MQSCECVLCTYKMIWQVGTNLSLYLMFVYFVFFLNRFLGSTKIHLRELSSGQVRSLPSRNVPLVNESGQNIGVSLTNLRNWKTIFKKKKKKWNNRASNLSIPGYNRSYDWLWSSSQFCTKPQWPSSRRCHSWCWYFHLILNEAVQHDKGCLCQVFDLWSSCLLIRWWWGGWWNFTRWGPKWLCRVRLIPCSTC